MTVLYYVLVLHTSKIQGESIKSSPLNTFLNILAVGSPLREKFYTIIKGSVLHFFAKFHTVMSTCAKTTQFISQAPHNFAFSIFIIRSNAVRRANHSVTEGRQMRGWEAKIYQDAVVSTKIYPSYQHDRN